MLSSSSTDTRPQQSRIIRSISLAKLARSSDFCPEEILKDSRYSMIFNVRFTTPQNCRAFKDSRAANLFLTRQSFRSKTSSRTSDKPRGRFLKATRISLSVVRSTWWLSLNLLVDILLPSLIPTINASWTLRIFVVMLECKKRCMLSSLVSTDKVSSGKI